MGTTRLAVRVGYQLLDLFYSLLEILTSISLSILILPLFAPLWLCNELSRLIVRTLLYYEYLTCTSSTRTRLVSNGVDGIWSYEKPGNSRNVLIVYVYSEPIDLAALQHNYLHSIVEKPEFAKLKKIFVKRYGYLCWKESAFDITNHVKYVDTGRGEDEEAQTVVTETELKSVILPALAQDMDETKPQWEELVIPNFQYDSEVEVGHPPRSARIYRSHHAYMDGGSTLMLCANMYSPDTECTKGEEDTLPYCTAPSFPYMVNPLAPPKVPTWKVTLYKVKCALLGLTTLAKILYEAAQLRSRFLVRGPYSGRQVFSLSPPIKLSTLKEIKEVARTSLPTVLSSVIGTSIQTLNNSNNANAATLPIGLVGAILPYPNEKPCNRFTVVNFPVSTTPSRTKLDNLKATQRSMSALTSSPNGYINYVLFRVFGKCPAFVLQFMMRKAGMSVIYSNSPWAMERVKLFGTPVQDVFGWMPLLTTAGIGILTVSYHDTLKFCVIADNACVSEKEVKHLTEELSAQVQELAEECKRHRAKNNNGPLLV